jgi:hypothetical protein
MEITTGYNRRLAQWRVSWLIEHSTSHQLLWYIDSFVLRIENPRSEIRHFAKRQTVNAQCKTKNIKTALEKE